MTHFVVLMSLLNFLFFHIEFYSFVLNDVDFKTLSGFSIIVSLIILMLALNFFVFYLIFFLSRRVGKFFLIVFFLLNSIAVYFINTYSVIIDESMIGNVFNTNYEESSSFFSLKFINFFNFLKYIFRNKTSIFRFFFFFLIFFIYLLIFL